MSSTQRLEGPDLEALLAKVRAEYGERARIVEANRLRKGGIAGFFARETYEVVVDVDDRREPAGRDRRDARGRSRDRAAAAAAAATRAAASTAAARRRAAAPAEVRGGAPVHEARGEADDAETFVPFTIDELATRIDDPAPDFTTALRSAVAEAEHAAGTGSGEDDGDRDPSSPAPAAAPAAEVDEAWPAEAAIADVTPVVAARPKVARLVAGGLDGVEAAEIRRRAPRPLVPARRAAAAVAETAPVPAPAPTPPVRVEHQVPDTGGLGRIDLDRLALLGVPVDRLALPARTDDPPSVALVRMFERLPAPPAMPRCQGAVVAVVGERRRASEIAEALGLEGEVVVASRRRDADVRTVADADERRRAWRRRKRPTVVVVDAPFTVDPDPWVAGVLDALEPVVALGTVDAGRKPEDVNAWSASLGGLDALAVDGLDRTTTPAAVLRAGLPVALIDGEPATPARWAALLTDRLAGAALAGAAA